MPLFFVRIPLLLRKREPLTPTLSPKGRGGRLCHYFCADPSALEGEGTPHPNPLPKEESGRPCHYFCADPSALEGEGSPHPNPFPKEERGPTVPLLLWGSRSLRGALSPGSPGGAQAYPACNTTSAVLSTYRSAPARSPPRYPPALYPARRR